MGLRTCRNKKGGTHEKHADRIESVYATLVSQLKKPTNLTLDILEAGIHHDHSLRIEQFRYILSVSECQ